MFVFEWALAHPFLTLLAVLAAVVVVAALGLRVIPEDRSGLVVKRFGPSLPAGRVIATDGEAGYQATLLPPGWHFPLWRWQYKVTRVPTVTVPAGEIALLVAADGAALPGDRILGKVVPCDDFQDAARFLRAGGQRGRQLGFLRAGTYRINPAAFTVITATRARAFDLQPEQLRVLEIPPDRVGVVTTLDGRPLAQGDLAGAPIDAGDSFQDGHAFLDAGGTRGLQEQVLLSGSWNLNPWFVAVETVPMTEIPIGYVGVVVSYVGDAHLDVSGASFTHGDLVERGRKGVWVEPLLPGKHPINTRVMKVELVPTTNIVLNWASRTEAHRYDEKLSPITVRSRDGFSFSLDVSQIIHVGMRNAPRVISRVGSMQNLVDHVLQPTVANYFRNSAQEVSVLEFLSARSDRQAQAYDAIRGALAAYDVECIDTLIGDIVPPAELMKTQTDRKIAEELQRTFDTQREAQTRRQLLERETAVANMQAEVVRSEQMVQIAEKNALASAEAARGEAMALGLRAQAEARALELRSTAEAAATRVRGEADAASTRAVGAAKAEIYVRGADALGVDAFTAMQLAATLAERGVKLVPDIAVGGGDGRGGLAEVLIGKMLTGVGSGALGSVGVSSPARAP
jgi:uncharacterized membrane protein YqiK